MPWLRRQLDVRPRPLWIVLTGHVLALGVALVVYALAHHVIPRGEAVVGVVSLRGGTAETVVQAQSAPIEADRDAAESDQEAVEAPSEAAAIVAAEAPSEMESAGVVDGSASQVAAVGDFRATHAAHFTSGEVIETENSYQSANVSVTVQREYLEEARSWGYFADIYIADISCLTTAFGEDQYGRGYTEWIAHVLERLGAVIAVNGDYYGTRDTGVVIRNGMLYRDNKTTNDIAILYWDGHMEMFGPEEFDAVREMERGAYQSWCFGPNLLNANGEPIDIFNAGYHIIKKNPRSAIGYYEPGHYCFAAVDGRNDKSHGASMAQLARFMQSHGCKLAYNLDGGQTSLLCTRQGMVNDPSDGGRSSSDYILILDRVAQ